MKKCPYCAEEIQEEAVICKHCGRDLRAAIPAQPQAGTPPVAKKKAPKWLTAIVFVIILCFLGLLGIVIFTPDAETPTAQKVGEATPISSSPAKTATSAPVNRQVYKIGDVIKVGDFTLVVNGISYPKPKEMFEPDSGNKFVAVDVTIENVGSESKSLFAMAQMTLKDDTGRDFSQDMNADISAGSSAPNGEIAPGEKKRGLIGYQVPEDAKGFQFVFDASLFSSGKVFVNLGE